MQLRSPPQWMVRSVDVVTASKGTTILKPGASAGSCVEVASCRVFTRCLVSLTYLCISFSSFLLVWGPPHSGGDIGVSVSFILKFPPCVAIWRRHVRRFTHGGSLRLRKTMSLWDFRFIFSKCGRVKTSIRTWLWLWLRKKIIIFIFI